MKNKETPTGGTTVEPEKEFDNLGNRYAREWFMRYKDEFTLNSANSYTDEKAKEMTKLIAVRFIISIGISTGISAALTAIFSVLLHKLLKR